MPNSTIGSSEIHKFKISIVTPSCKCLIKIFDVNNGLILVNVINVDGRSIQLWFIVL